jgi:hypothetical protein
MAPGFLQKLMGPGQWIRTHNLLSSSNLIQELDRWITLIPLSTFFSLSHSETGFGQGLLNPSSIETNAYQLKA